MNKLYEEKTIKELADVIRLKSGTSDLMDISDMVEVTNGIQSMGEINKETVEQYKLVKAKTEDIGITYYGISLQNTIEGMHINLLFTYPQGKTVDEYEVTENGNPIEMVKRNSKYFQISTSDYFIKSLDDMKTITVIEKATGNQYSLIVSPLSYVYNVLKSSSARQIDIDYVKSMYLYHKYCKIMFSE